MISNIPSAYNPKLTEEKWYDFWEANKLFHAEYNPEKKPYCIVIPPPNVTGILHMGHALNNTIQDILIRYKRMKGFEPLWMPGTDHAGIATQNVVEKELAKEGLKRQDLGREKFLERVWKWKEDYGSTIIKQLKKLGCSCDWERLRFTMDEEYSKAVRKAFIALWVKKPTGVIYQDDKVINWCPRCQTALSDEEAPHRELEGNLYYIKYPLKKSTVHSRQSTEKNKSVDRGPLTVDHIVVATTRPETMLGDTAVAVNPKDKRYEDLIQETVVVPLINREIKIIADNMVDMKFGTGAVKVTPAHDTNDDILGKKYKLSYINIFTPEARLNKNAGDYAGMDRFEAREVILEDLKDAKLLERIEPHKIAAGHCYRCHTIIEPYLSKQWFVRMRDLAKPAIKAVKDGKIKFHPKRWTKVYLNWMENIQDWCISRQIWWGHRLPVYYCKSCSKQANESTVDSPQSTAKNKSADRGQWTVDEKGIIISRVKPERCPTCGSVDIIQDEDVLDTWFSSWLWPFATFGWPFEDNEGRGTRDEGRQKELNYFYPTSALITAQEIIFFWVARMIMAGLEFMKDIPFKDVYIHGTVRDDIGKKMSKSLGNIIDPLDIINEFGADALRFSIISITAAGQDVFLSRQKFELGRNFANKIWNASRFIITNLKPQDVKVDLCVSYASLDMNLADKWILSRFYQALHKAETAIENYRFNEAASLIYEFFWHEFCDWYIEFSKPFINEPHTQIVLYKVLEKSLRILHPFMPFITEEIWSNLLLTTNNQQLTTIMTQPWPHMQKQMINKKIDSQMQILIDSITAIRNIRANWNIDPSAKIDIIIKAKKEAAAIFSSSEAYIKNLARVKELNVDATAKKPPKSAAAVIKDIEIYIPLEQYINVREEKERLSKKIGEISDILKGIDAKLKNKEFLKKAPREVVKSQKERKAEFTDTLRRLKDNFRDLE